MRKKKKPAFYYIHLVFWVVFGVINFILTSHIEDIYHFSLFVILMITIVSVKDFAAKEWRDAFSGTVSGRVFIKNNDTKIIPLKNVEISYSSPFLEKPGVPVFSDVKGRFCFEDVVPVHKPITLEAKIGEDRLVYQHIGRIEGVKWFLGQPSLKLPLSSGEPMHVDFVVPTPAN